jgi:tetratricopeptide (TPR) repeat protein
MFEFHMIRTTFVLRIVLAFCFSSSLLANTTDSLEQRLKAPLKDSARVEVLIELANANQNKDPEKALLYAGQAKTLSEKAGYKNGMAKSLLQYGVYWSYKENFANALNFFLEAQKILEANGNKEGLASVVMDIANIHQQKGDFAKALEYQLKALRINEDLKNKEGMAGCYDNIGILYAEQGEFDKATHYMEQALTLNRERKDLPKVANTIGNIGLLAKMKGDTAKAIASLREAIRINKEINDRRGEARSLLNLGFTYSAMEKYKTALDCYFEALKISEEIGDADNKMELYLDIGAAYFYLKDYPRAKQYYQDDLVMASKGKSKTLLKSLYEALSQLYEKSGDKSAALENYKMYITYRDSIFNGENTRKTIQAQMDFDFEKKQQAMLLSEKEKELVVKEEIKRQAVLRNAFIAGFGLMFLLALAVFRGYRIKRKANMQLVKLNDEVTNQKFVIEEKHKSIQTVSTMPNAFSKPFSFPLKIAKTCFGNILYCSFPRMW